MIVRYATLIILIVLSASGVHADDEVRAARYSTIEPVATKTQEQPLQVVVQIQFPPRITTLQKAFEQLLRRSGYRMAAAENADPKLETLLRNPLPEVHRQLGPITLESALSTLAGPTWTLVVDPVHRLVSFELLETYPMPTPLTNPGSSIEYHGVPRQRGDEDV